MKKYREFPRKHGFEKPFNIFQVLSWILFGCNLLAYYFIIIPPSEFASQMTFISVFFIFSLMTAFFGYKATITDPTDSTVYEERSYLAKNLEYVTDLKQFCTVCSTHVKPRTKHCGQCNRCAEVFDHHCKWLNNCVGARNYKWFILLILSLFLLMVLKIATSIYNVFLFSEKREDFQRNISTYYKLSACSEEMGLAFFIASMIVFLQDPIILFLLLDLIILHIFLKYKKMTTYEFIVMQRSNKDKNQINVNNQLPNSNRPKPIIKIESENQLNNQFLNPNFYSKEKEKKQIKIMELNSYKKNSAITNQSSLKESKRTIDFTNTVIEESKKNNDNKKNLQNVTIWNSNCTTPQNFVNDEDGKEYSNSSIFADIETRNYEIKPQKHQQTMMFKRKLNNVIFRTKSSNKAGYLNDPITYAPHKKKKESSVNINRETFNLNDSSFQNRDESTLEILNFKKNENETTGNILMGQEENVTYNIPNIVQEETKEEKKNLE